MSNETTNEQETFLIIDESGNYFALPTDVVESHRLSPEERASVDEALGEDVQGFAKGAGAGTRGSNVYQGAGSGISTQMAAKGPSLMVVRLRPRPTWVVDPQPKPQ
jgi:hypothetical protein